MTANIQIVIARRLALSCGVGATLPCGSQVEQ